MIDTVETIAQKEAQGISPPSFTHDTDKAIHICDLQRMLHMMSEQALPIHERLRGCRKSIVFHKVSEEVIDALRLFEEEKRSSATIWAFHKGGLLDQL